MYSGDFFKICWVCCTIKTAIAFPSLQQDWFSPRTPSEAKYPSLSRPPHRHNKILKYLCCICAVFLQGSGNKQVVYARKSEQHSAQARFLSPPSAVNQAKSSQNGLKNETGGGKHHKLPTYTGLNRSKSLSSVKVNHGIETLKNANHERIQAAGCDTSLPSNFVIFTPKSEFIRPNPG